VEYSDALRQHGDLAFQVGAFRYLITRSAHDIVYTVSDGSRSIAAPLGWAFGAGEVGQTFVFERNGAYYESYLSYFSNLRGLDITPGHNRSGPTQLEGAAGRELFPSEASLCFGCHFSESTIRGQFDPRHAVPGVICEACHGPGEGHVTRMKLGQIDAGRKAVFNPARLDAVDSIDFCGACHRTPWDVVQLGTPGVFNVRFQPYRLVKSRCWGKGDARLTCRACHDPHQPLVQDLAAYDGRCLACHARTEASKSALGRRVASCPVATRACVDCHMPKVEVADMHAPYTDHYIRIVRHGQPYPD